MPRRKKRGKPGGTKDILQTGNREDAVVAGPLRGARFHYVEGFRLSIENDYEAWLESDRDDYQADILIFPLGLSCRHLIELQLKELYEELELGDVAPDTHSLLKLWRMVRPAIEQRWRGANRSTRELYGHLSEEKREEFGITLRAEGRVDRAELLVKALHEVDPKGVAFRYPGEMRGPLKAIGIGPLVESTLELSAYLDGLVTGIFEDKQAAAQMAPEFDPEDLAPEDRL